MADKKPPTKDEKAKDFELALDAYGEAHKLGNIPMKDKNRVKLLALAGLTTKQTASNTPGK